MRKNREIIEGHLRRIRELEAENKLLKSEKSKSQKLSQKKYHNMRMYQVGMGGCDYNLYFLADANGGFNIDLQKAISDMENEQDFIYIRHEKGVVIIPKTAKYSYSINEVWK